MVRQEEIELPVCCSALLSWENEHGIRCRWKDKTAMGTHKRHWPGSIVRAPRLRSLPPLHPPFTGARHILSLPTHASPARTPPPLLLRGGTAVSERALPLRGADRALIWGLMLRKSLIKRGAVRKRQGLITASESILTLWANWPGSERPAAGQRLGHLMAPLSRCRWVYFYALSPSSLLPFNELGLVIRRALSKLGWLCSGEPPHGENLVSQKSFFETPNSNGAIAQQHLVKGLIKLNNALFAEEHFLMTPTWYWR